MGDDSFAACHLHQVLKSDDDDVVVDDEGGDGQMHQVHNSGPRQHQQFIFPSIWWTGNILILISVFDQNQNLKALVNFIFWFSSEQWNIF